MEFPNRTNVAVLFLDLQSEIVKNSKTQSRHDLEKSGGALAKLAALHHLPWFLSSVSVGGDYLSAILKPLGDPALYPRMETSAFADPKLVADLRATGRTVLVLAGVASEIVVQRTALDACAAGFTVQVAVDACGGSSERREEAAWRRIGMAGAVTTSVTTLCAELAGDFSTELGGATLGIMYETLG